MGTYNFNGNVSAENIGDTEDNIIYAIFKGDGYGHDALVGFTTTEADANEFIKSREGEFGWYHQWCENINQYEI